MKRIRLFATALALVVLAVLAGRATAQNLNTQERTFLTFNTAVELPGVQLQPGTYVFKLADTGSRNVVQVWDQDEKRMIGHWTFVQAERSSSADDTIVMFRETRDGSTPAVQYWYFPGERIGKEFLYPKDQAERIAARTGATVRTEDSPVERVAAAAAEPVSAPAPIAEVGQQEPPAAAAAPKPVAEPPAIAAAAPAPAPVVEESRVAAAAPPPPAPKPRAIGTGGQSEELPRTASPLALIGLLGLLSLAGSAGIRVSRN